MSMIRRVLIIGAGSAGLCCAARLRDEFGPTLHIVIAERRADIGGMWHYDPTGQHYCIAKGNRAFDPEPILVQKSGLYADLRTNLPARSMAYRNHPFSDDVNALHFPPHAVVMQYLRGYVDKHGLRELVVLNTVVTRVVKQHDAWTCTLLDTVQQASRDEVFDAVVAANGHHNMPRVPEDMQGLLEFAQVCPERVLHSKDFVKPQDYTGKTVLIVGNGYSAKDMRRLLVPHAKHIHHAIRPDTATTVVSTLPPLPTPDNVTKHVEVTSVDATRTTFADGSSIDTPDVVLLCTGYLYSFPFLTGTPLERELIGDDGDYARNLYQHIFYVHDPTLVFLGLQFKLTPFNYTEYEALYVARVWNRVARLPSTDSMLEWETKLPKDRSRHIVGLQGQVDFVRTMMHESRAPHEQSDVVGGLREMEDWWIELRQHTEQLRRDLVGY